MNARADLLRWIRIGTIVGLLALLAVANVQAQAPEVGELVVAPAYGLASLAIHCETGILEDGDPFMSPDHVDVACPGLAAPEIQSIMVTGNVSYIKVLVGDEIEHHFYLKKDGVWERFPYSPQPEWDYQYELEQENQGLGQFGAPPQAAPEPSSATELDAAAMDVAADVRGENYWNEWFARLQGTRPEATPTDISAALRDASEQEFQYMIEQENRALGLLDSALLPETAGPSASVDVYDPAFLEMIEQENIGLGLVDPAFQPAPGSRAAGGPRAPSSSADETSSIDLREHEIDLASGSTLNTRADLFSALFGHSWTTNVAGEDLARGQVRQQVRDVYRLHQADPR